MAIISDKTAVPIPKMTGITIDRNGSRVLYVLSAPYNPDKGYAEPRRCVIGHLTDQSKTTMYPTENYSLLFPKLWEQYSGEKPRHASKRLGMYTLVQAVNQKNGIVDIVNRAFGESASDRILDYAMYSILHHSDSTAQFESRMEKQALFSSKPYSDTAYSAFFENEMSDEDILSFKKLWAQQCIDADVKDVWLCIDGSNDDCHSQGVDIAEKGKAKSLRNTDIVSFTYAVTADGLPVTFEVYRGGLVDAKAMKRIIEFLDAYEIRIKGVILDRGYCSADVIQYLKSHNLAYVIMVKSNPDGYIRMVKEYGRSIKLDAKRLVLKTHLFAVQSSIQLFENYKHEDWLTLFYDYRNGTERIESYLEKCYREIERVEEKLAHGQIPEISAEYSRVIHIVTDGNRNEVTVNRDELQKAFDEKGLYGIVTSEKMTPEEVNAHYGFRNASETQFMFTKTELGYGKVRVTNTRSVRARFAIGFIAAVIRYEIEQAAKKEKMSTTTVINDMNLLEMMNLNGTYAYVHEEKESTLKVLKHLNVKKTIFEDVVNDENNRCNGIHPQPRHRKPGPKKKPKAKAKSAGNEEHRKRGVKPGIKRGDLNKDGSQRKKPGVQPGTVRPAVNKDGTPRKKPGPKPKETTTS